MLFLVRVEGSVRDEPIEMMLGDVFFNQLE